MEVMEAIRKRRSVRSFSNTPVPQSVIEEMLDAARLAPTPGNGQAHRFGVVDDPDLIRQLAEAAGNQMWIAQAPLVIACCADTSWDLGAVSPDDFAYIVNVLRFGKVMVDYLNSCPDRRGVARLLGNGASAMGAEHMLLVAASHGLQGCFVGYLDVKRAEEILCLPDNISCMFLLPIGYPALEPAPKPKLTCEEISFRNRWI